MKIVMLDSKTIGDDINTDIFNELGEFTKYIFTNQEDVVKRIHNAEVVIGNKINFTKEVLVQCPNIKLICVTATGYNNVDIDYCKQNSILVSNVAGYSTYSVAQHTFAMLFYMLEHLRYYDDYVMNKKYVNDEMFTHFSNTFHDLSNKTYGIVGLGNIGKQVAKIAEAFGANVVYYSTSNKNNNNEYKQVDFDTLLKTSDIISIHCPLNENTLHLFDIEQLKKMKQSSYLLNLGRGAIVTEEAVVYALNNNLIKGIGLDVLVEEPMSESSLLLDYLHDERLFITPHIGWASKEARTKVITEVYLNIKAYKKGNSRNNVY